MALATYTPKSDQIIHETMADMNGRPIGEPVHLVQYDDRIPILAVSMYNNGQPYTIPSSASANIRWGKKNHKFVVSKALGYSSDRQILYFEIELQMVTDYGPTDPIIEIDISGKTAGSSPIHVVIDQNPVQQGDIESSVVFKEAEDFAKAAEDAAKKASESASNAESSANKSSEYAFDAEASKNAAAASANNLKQLLFNNQLILNGASNALKGREKGDILFINDVSPLNQELDIQLSSKNVFNYGWNFGNMSPSSTIEKEENAITFISKNGGGYVRTTDPTGRCFNLKPNTTYTSKATITLTNLSEEPIVGITYVTQLYLSSAFVAEPDAPVIVIVGGHNATSYGTKPGTYELTTTFTTPEDLSPYKYLNTRLQDRTSVRYENIMICEGTDQQDYVPYADISNVEVMCTGKNMLNPDAENTQTLTSAYYGIDTSFLNGKDVTLHIKLKDGKEVPTDFSFGIAYKVKSGSSIGAFWMFSSTNNPGVLRWETRSFNLLKGYGLSGIVIGGANKKNWEALFDIFDIQLEIGTKATEYEPFKDEKLAISDDNGKISGLFSLYPEMSIVAKSQNVIVDCTYNRDLNKVIDNLVQAIISLGGNV